MNCFFNAFKRWDINIFIFFSAFFVLFPQVDMWFTGLFYSQENGFYWNDIAWVGLTYKIFAKLQIVILPLLIFAAVVFYKKYKKTNHHKKVIFSFLLASLICGPGLLVNVALKDHSIGRARPVNIQEFGGDMTFTRAFEYSGQCQKNCSFVSGHASMGFFFIGLGWWFRKKWAFWLGFVLGAYVGFIRIVQGGHFFSDVVLAFWAVYFTNQLLAYVFKIELPTIRIVDFRNNNSV